MFFEHFNHKFQKAFHQKTSVLISEDYKTYIKREEYLFTVQEKNSMTDSIKCFNKVINYEKICS